MPTNLLHADRGAVPPSPQKHRRKFQHITVRQDVLITSSRTYFVDVCYEEHGTPWAQTFLINAQSFLVHDGYDTSKPRYLVATVMRLLCDAYQTHELRFYEYTSERQKRTEHLRYFDDAMFRALLAL